MVDGVVVGVVVGGSVGGTVGGSLVVPSQFLHSQNDFP